jgi:hypothetical protein
MRACNEFIDGVLADASEDNRKTFLDGLAWLDTHTTEAHGAPFTKLTHEQQVAVLTALSKLSPDASPVPPGAEFFQAIKSSDGHRLLHVGDRHAGRDRRRRADVLRRVHGLHAQGTRRRVAARQLSR